MRSVFSTVGLFLAAVTLSGCGTNVHYDVRHVTAFAVIVIIIALFLTLAAYSNILRDEISDCEEFDANAQKIQQHQRTKVNKENPFSLTKVQFGLWTVVISSAYIYLSLCKGDCAAGTINKTALVLMGIFAGTAAASTIIDKREMNDNRPRHQNTPSQGFFVDILSDDNGISLHRFQNFVWTLIAVIVYLYKLQEVSTGCLLPELSDTLLALTGISSATYVLLRSKENDPAAEEAQKNASDAAAPDTAGQ